MAVKKKTEGEKTGGQGKKTCPGCGAVVGARLGVCDCGHQFQTATKKKKVAERDPDMSVVWLVQFSIVAKEFGGLAKVQADVERLKPLIDHCGGIDNLFKAVEQLELLKKLK
jgi:hypothetical protein